MDEQADRGELCGTIESLIFRSDEGFAVFRLLLSARESVIIRGALPGIHEGQRVMLRGQWVNHPKFGRQFQVSQCSAQLPASAEGIRRYLASGLVKGIGPAYATRLVDAFGAQTLEIIDKFPDRLYEVAGLGAKRVARIQEAWIEQKEISSIMVFLQDRGVSPGFAAKIFKAYGSSSLEVIQKNPYKLAEDIWGVGFRSADQLASKMGLTAQAPERIAAGIQHCIAQATDAGHLYVEAQALQKSVRELLELPDNEASVLQIKAGLRSLYEAEKIIVVSKNDAHFISLPKYHFSEKGIASKIKRLAELPSGLSRLDISSAYQELRMPDMHGFELNEDQQRGILAALQHKVSIVTGGPGTGKTTLIRRLLSILQAHHVRFKLAAPTGRAAKRMFEGTGISAETLHRLLEFSPVTMGFTRDERRALELEFLIIDEASMIDVFLMHSLLKALPLHAHILFLGDVDQLPSVGAGDVLRDMIASEKVLVTRLTQIFRQAQDSLIVVNAHRVNKGEFPLVKQEGSRNDFLYIRRENTEDLAGVLQALYARLAQRHIAPHDTVVLSPMNRGDAGVARLNQVLQTILNSAAPGEPAPTSVTRHGVEYRVRDRVMQIRNNYDKFVFNGDMGYIENINHEDRELTISFGEKNHVYEFDELDEIVLAYATSIHKSQGSEFKAVIIPLFSQHFMMLQRNLIYTAITRAKQLCIIVGEPKAIAMGIRNKKAVGRITFLKDFLQE